MHSTANSNSLAIQTAIFLTSSNVRMKLELDFRKDIRYTGADFAIKADFHFRQILNTSINRQTKTLHLKVQRGLGDIDATRVNSGVVGASPDNSRVSCSKIATTNNKDSTFKQCKSDCSRSSSYFAFHLDNTCSCQGARSDASCPFKNSNAVLYKFTRQDLFYEKSTACGNVESLNLTCPRSHHLHTLMAFRGRNNPHTCGSVDSTKWCYGMVSTKVAELCEGKEKCEIEEGGRNLLDDCKKHTRYLQVMHTCIGKGRLMRLPIDQTNVLVSALLVKDEDTFYICVYPSVHRSCHYTADNGQSWKGLDTSLRKIHGYNPEIKALIVSDTNMTPMLVGLTSGPIEPINSLVEEMGTSGVVKASSASQGQLAESPMSFDSSTHKWTVHETGITLQEDGEEKLIYQWAVEPVNDS